MEKALIYFEISLDQGNYYYYYMIMMIMMIIMMIMMMMMIHEQIHLTHIPLRT